MDKLFSRVEDLRNISQSPSMACSHPTWLAITIWIRDVFPPFLSDPGTFGAGGSPSQTRFESGDLY